MTTATLAQAFGFSDEVADYARSVIEMVALPPEHGGAGLSGQEGASALKDLLAALVKLEDGGSTADAVASESTSISRLDV